MSTSKLPTALPKVTGIAWFPWTKPNTAYRVTFAGPLSIDDVEALHKYVRQHDGISNLLVCEGDLYDSVAYGVVVECNKDDTVNYEVLAWLQDMLRPVVSLTGVVQLFTSVRPVVARIRLIGTVDPHYRKLFIAGIRRMAQVRDVQDDETGYIAVTFNDDLPENVEPELILALNPQLYVTLTVLIEPGSVPTAEERP